jgi:glutathione S-transferase
LEKPTHTGPAGKDTDALHANLVEDVIQRGQRMIKIYHAKRARGARVIWLLEELGVPYEIEPIEFKPEVLKSAEHVARHPLGQLPVVEVDGVRFFESGAHLQYFLERYGQGRLEPKPGTTERAEYLQWFHFGEASLAVYVSQIVRQRFGRPAGEQSADIVNDARERLASAACAVDLALAQRPYICGDAFSAADIMGSYGLVMSRIIRELPDQLAHVPAYLERLKERPAYARAWS